MKLHVDLLLFMIFLIVVDEEEKKVMSNRGIEPVTFALLARRSNQLS